MIPPTKAFIVRVMRWAYRYSPLAVSELGTTTGGARVWLASCEVLSTKEPNP